MENVGAKQALPPDLWKDIPLELEKRRKSVIAGCSTEHADNAIDFAAHLRDEHPDEYRAFFPRPLTSGQADWVAFSSDTGLLSSSERTASRGELRSPRLFVYLLYIFCRL